MKPLYLAGIGTALAAAAVVTLILQSTREGDADPSIPPVVKAEMPTPVVSGRQILIVSGDGVDARGSPTSWTSLCEFEALVVTEGSTVTKIDKQTNGEPIQTGDTVIGIQDLEPTDDGAHVPESGPLGQIHTDQPVYWDSEGKLQSGCAPESVTMVATPPAR